MTKLLLNSRRTWLLTCCSLLCKVFQMNHHDYKVFWLLSHLRLFRTNRLRRFYLIAYQIFGQFFLLAVLHEECQELGQGTPSKKYFYADILYVRSGFLYPKKDMKLTYTLVSLYTWQSCWWAPRNWGWKISNLSLNETGLKVDHSPDQTCSRRFPNPFLISGRSQLLVAVSFVSFSSINIVFWLKEITLRPSFLCLESKLDFGGLPWSKSIFLLSCKLEHKKSCVLSNISALHEFFLWHFDRFEKWGLPERSYRSYGNHL